MFWPNERKTPKYIPVEGEEISFSSTTYGLEHFDNEILKWLPKPTLWGAPAKVATDYFRWFETDMRQRYLAWQYWEAYNHWLCSLPLVHMFNSFF